MLPADQPRRDLRLGKQLRPRLVRCRLEVVALASNGAAIGRSRPKTRPKASAGTSGSWRKEANFGEADGFVNATRSGLC